MSKELPFIILCMEQYKNHKNLNGKEVLEVFNKYMIFDYIKSFYAFLNYWIKRMTKQSARFAGRWKWQMKPT